MPGPTGRDSSLIVYILPYYYYYYREGSEVQLSCIVVGGKPPPRVVWYKNSQLFSEQFVREEDAMTGALVTYNNLSLLAIPRYVEGELTVTE